MKKLLFIVLAFLSFEYTYSQPGHKPEHKSGHKPGNKTSVYRVRIDVGHGKNNGTDDVVIFKLKGEKQYQEFKLDKEGINDHEGGMEEYILKPDFDLGRIKSFRLKVIGKDGKIDDLFVESLELEDLNNNLTTGRIKYNQWIGDGEHAHRSWYKIIEDDWHPKH